GRRIAFISTRDKSDQIYVMNADGSNVSRLTMMQGRKTAVAFGPDGAQVIFTAELVRNYVEPYVTNVTNVDASNLQPLTVPPTWISYAKLSPDGSKIVSSGMLRNVNFVEDIYLMNLDGSNPLPLTSSAGSNTNPSFSPDGRMIVFVSTRGGNLQIYAM